MIRLILAFKPAPPGTLESLKKNGVNLKDN